MAGSVGPLNDATTVLVYGKLFYFRLLMSSEELRLFDKVRVYLDEDYSSAENFTVGINYHSVSIQPPFVCMCVCVCVCTHKCLGTCACMHWSVSLPSTEASSIVLLLHVKLKMTARKMIRK